MTFDKEMQDALIADGEKLTQLTGEDHGPYFITDSLVPGKYWGNTEAELKKALSDLNRWATANRESSITFERMGAPVEATMMRNAAEEQTNEFFRVEKMLDVLRKGTEHD